MCHRRRAGRPARRTGGDRGTVRSGGSATGDDRRRPASARVRGPSGAFTSLEIERFAIDTETTSVRPYPRRVPVAVTATTHTHMCYVASIELRGIEITFEPDGELAHHRRRTASRWVSRDGPTRSEPGRDPVRRGPHAPTGARSHTGDGNGDSRSVLPVDFGRRKTGKRRVCVLFW